MVFSEKGVDLAEAKRPIVEIRHLFKSYPPQLDACMYATDTFRVSVFAESAHERISRGLPRGKRVKTIGFVPLKDRRFSAACCGELQYRGNKRPLRNPLVGFSLRIQAIRRYLIIQRGNNVPGANGGHLDSRLRGRGADMRRQHNVGKFG